MLAWAAVKWIDEIEATERRTNWWDVGAHANKPTWDEVRRMAIGSEEEDPIAHEPTLRKGALSSSVKMVAGYLIVFSLAIELLSIPVSGSVLALLFTDGSASWKELSTLKLDANLTAFLALLAAAISIYFAHRQLQANSRQAWIDKLRAHIAQFIALADEAHYGTRTGQPRATKLTACRLEMELMLNPSERDHRLLMFLGLKLAFFEVGQEDLERVHDVRFVLHAIRQSSGHREGDWKPLLGPIPPKSPDPIKYEQEYSDLVGYTMRLAHVVLKREWERVEATR